MRFGFGSLGGVGIACGLVLAAVTPGQTALAQSPDPGPPPPMPSSKIHVPHWVKLPSGDDFDRNYPNSAAKKNVGGSVVLSCSVIADGKLDHCTVVKEDPTGFGFGDAGLKLAQYFQMTTQTDDGKPTAGAMVVIPLKFVLPD